MHINKYSSKKHNPAKQQDAFEIGPLLSAERSLAETCLDAELTYTDDLLVNLKLPRTLLHLMLSKHSITTHLDLQSVS
jgi:hypothetical protein